MTTVYVSSTYSDLKDYREAVCAILRQMHYDVIAMEDYVATDQRPKDKCLEDVRSCDLYVGIFAWRYGFVPSVDNPQCKSITELEYRTAAQAGKTCLIFLVEENAPWPPTAMDVVTGENDRGERIQSLRQELIQEKLVKFFSTREQLASTVSTSIHQWKILRDSVQKSGSKVHVHKKNEKKSEREQRLKAMIANQSGFIHDRLGSFVGRQRELAQIRQQITAKLPSGGYVTITGQAGQGKSSIIAKLVMEYGADKVANHFIPFNPGPDHQVGLLRSLMARLILKYNLAEIYVASESRPALRDYFPKVLGELAAKGGQEVIFIDGLDQLEEELSGVRDLSFLPNNPPPGVVFVLGTRPNDTLRPLELLKPHHEYQLPNLSRSDFDLILHHRQVNLDQSLADQFYRVMQENALYLDLVARELAEGGTSTPVEIIRRVADNPNSIFSLSMARLKRDHTHWREVIKPVLGVLLTAREPLSIRQIRNILGVEYDWLREGIERLGGLIAKDGQQRCSLFHLKLQDYLREDESRPDKEYIFAVDEEEKFHEKLAVWCEQGHLAIIWQDIKGNPTEQERREYARYHYISHLYRAKKWQQLFNVLDSEAYGRAKIQHDPSTRSFALDLNLGRYAATGGEKTLEEGLAALPQLWRYTLLRCSLTSRVDKYPIEAFDALVLMKREAEAIGLAELLTRPEHKVRVLLHIARQFGSQENRKQEYLQMLLRALEVVHTIQIRDKEHNGLLRKLGIELVKAQLWEHTHELVRIIKVSVERAKVQRELAIALAREHQWERAEQAAHEIGESKERVEALGYLVLELIKANMWKHADEIVHYIDFPENYPGLLSEISLELIKVQQWKQAEKIVTLIRERDVRDKVLQELVMGLIQSQQWAHAENVVLLVSANELCSELWQMLIAALVGLQQWEQAERIACAIEESEMRTTLLTVLGIQLAKAHQWKWAERVIHLINDQKNLVKVINVLSIELARTHKWKKAEQVTLIITDTRARSRILTELGVELVELQQWERAEELAYKLEEYEDRNSVLSELSVGLLKAGISAKADEILICIKKDTQAIEIWQHDAILVELGIGLARAQQWKRAKKVANDIEDEDERSKLLYTLVIELAKAGHWKWAQKVWNQAENEISWSDEAVEMRTQALYKLAKVLTKVQQEELARKMWLKTKEIVWDEISFRIKDFKNFILLLSTFVSELAEAHQWNLMEELLAEAKGDIESIEDCEERAEIFIELGEALKGVYGESVVGVGEGIGNLETYAESFIELGTALANESWWTQIEEEIDLLVDKKERAQALSELSIALGEECCWEHAIEVAYTIEDSNESDAASISLGTALAKAKRWNQAKEVIGAIEDNTERTRVLYVLIAELAKSQQWKWADEVWEQARKVEWADEETVDAFIEIGVTFAKKLQWAQAEEVWKQVRAMIGSFQDTEKQIQSFIKLNIQLVKLQQWEQAKEVWEITRLAINRTQSSLLESEETSVETEEEEAALIAFNVMDRDRALIELSLALAQAQQWERAEEIIPLVTNRGSKARALIELGKQYAYRQKDECASRTWNRTLKEIYHSDNWERSDILKNLGCVLAQAQRWEEVEEVIQLIDDLASRTEVLMELGKHYAIVQQTQRAKKAWERALDVTRFIDDAWIKANLLRELAIILAQMQEWQWAEEVAFLLGNTEDEVEVLIESGRHLAKAGRASQAQDIWDKANKKSHAIKYNKTRVEMLQKLALVMAESQQSKPAEILLHQAKEKVSLIKGKSDKDEALLSLSEAFTHLHLWENATEIISKIEDDRLRARTLIDFSQRLVAAEQWERVENALSEAEIIATTLVNIGDKAEIIKGIAEVLGKTRKDELLLRLVQRSWSAANTREEAIKLLPIANELISLKPEMGISFCEAFKWAETILKG